MKEVVFPLDKVLRDKMPDILADMDVKLDTTIIGGDLLLEALCKKFLEEGQEALAVYNKTDKLVGELADILEVIHALCYHTGLTMDEIEIRRVAKREERGGFEKGIHNTCATMAATNPARRFYEK